MPESQLAYWCGIDWSSPSWWRIAARARGSTPWIAPPSLVIVGSPGITRIRQKMTIELKKSSTMLVATRRATYAIIDPARSAASPLRLLRLAALGHEVRVLQMDVAARILPDPGDPLLDGDDVGRVRDRQHRR